MAVIFVRHGQAVDESGAAINWREALQHPWNPPLSPVGQQEAKSLASELDSQRRSFGVPPLKRIFASPFLHCIETAAGIAQEVGLARVCVEPSLAVPFSEEFYRSWAVPGCCVAQNPTEDVRPEALMEAQQLVPCDWSRHPEWAPASVDTSYEPVLRSSQLHYHWGTFEEPLSAMERLYRFLNFVTSAFANETALLVTHTSLLQTWLQRECPSFRMGIDRCCGLCIKHTPSSNGYSWRALGLVSPGCVPVELNLALQSRDWSKVRAEHQVRMEASANRDASRKHTSDEALEMLERMKEKELQEMVSKEKEAQARIQDAWAEAQKLWQKDNRAQQEAERKRQEEQGLPSTDDEALRLQRQREYEEIERKSQAEQEQWLRTREEALRSVAEEEKRAEEFRRRQLAVYAASQGGQQPAEAAAQPQPSTAEEQPQAAQEEPAAQGAEQEEAAEEEKEETTARNVAEGRPAKASSIEIAEYGPECAVDGSSQTRWLSTNDEKGWLMVDLGKPFRLARVMVHWHKRHYPESYLVQGSYDGLNWKQLAFEHGTGGQVVTKLPAGTSARFVRVYAEQPADLPRFSIWHLKVYNIGGPRTDSSGMDMEPFTVTVSTIAGEQVTLECKPGEVVASLSQRVSEKLGWGTSVAKLAAGQDVLEMAAIITAEQAELTAVREPRATRALSGSVDGTLQLCNVETGEALSTLRGHGAVITCVTADFMQQRALSGSRDRTLRVWNLENGQVLMVFEAHEGHVNCVAADFTAQLAVSGSDDKTLRLWDLDRAVQVRTMCQDGEVASVAVDFELSRALTGGQDGVLRLWDLQTGKALWEQVGHRGGASCLAADFRRGRAVSGGDDKTLRLWDLQRGRAGCILKGHTNFVRCVEADFGLKRALSGGADATLRLWDLDREAMLLTIRTNAGWVWCLAVNFKEERALSGSARENSLRMWDLKSGDPVSAASPALGTQGVRCVVTNFA